MARRWWGLVVLVALIAPGLMTADASPLKAISGDFASVGVAPPACTSPVGICTHGVLTGDLPSTYDFVMDTLFAPNPAEPNHLVYTGHSVIRRIHGGAVLYGTDSGVMDTTNPFAAPFVTTVNIVDGTKQYAGAAGQIVATGTLSLITGDAVGTYTGTIDKHAAR